MARLSQYVNATNLSKPRRVARLRAAFWAVEDALLTRTVRRARGMPAVTSTAPNPPRSSEVAPSPPSVSDDRVRVLRWVFSRGAEQLTCELALSDDDACYELRTRPSTKPASRTLERFSDVTAALQRQCTLEGSLVAEGWSLDAYESILVERTRSKTA